VPALRSHLRAPINQPTKRLTRCERCRTERADGLNSLAAVHPELVLEFGHDANKRLRPDRIKATYDKTVVWRRLDDPSHPARRMSQYARAKVEIGCKIGRKRRRVRRQGKRGQRPIVMVSDAVTSAWGEELDAGDLHSEA
jgi:hypothetical protein